MRLGRGDRKRRSPAESELAADEANTLAAEVPALLEEASGVDWYHRAGNEADRAAYKLCLLRRARSGARGGSEYGDEAVRVMLAAASPDALVWLASRAISYMDENGFPEDLEPWFGEMSSSGDA
jgi:hypothetical protein